MDDPGNTSNDHNVSNVHNSESLISRNGRLRPESLPSEEGQGNASTDDPNTAARAVDSNFSHVHEDRSEKVVNRTTRTGRVVRAPKKLDL